MRHLQLIENQVNKIITGVLKFTMTLIIVSFSSGLLTAIIKVKATKALSVIRLIARLVFEVFIGWWHNLLLDNLLVIELPIFWTGRHALN